MAETFSEKCARSKVVNPGRTVQWHSALKIGVRGTFWAKPILFYTLLFFSFKKLVSFYFYIYLPV